MRSNTGRPSLSQRTSTVRVRDGSRCADRSCSSDLAGTPGPVRAEGATGVAVVYTCQSGDAGSAPEIRRSHPPLADGCDMSAPLVSARPATEARRPAPQPSQWWRTAVVYQVYLRSFADGNGDGIGDLAGLRSRLPYLVWLGVHTLWSNATHPPGGPHGVYDVKDYHALGPDLRDMSK